MQNTSTPIPLRSFNPHVISQRPRRQSGVTTPYRRLAPQTQRDIDDNGYAPPVIYTMADQTVLRYSEKQAYLLAAMVIRNSRPERQDFRQLWPQGTWNESVDNKHTLTLSTLNERVQEILTDWHCNR